MKKIYLSLFIASVCFEAHAQIVSIPDPDFKLSLIEAGVDTNNDGIIQLSEALGVTTLDVSGLHRSVRFHDITGIEAFTDLIELNCDYNYITTLNVSTLTALQRLTFQLNQVSSVDVTGLTELTFLDCRDNLLSDLDVSNNIHLTSLWCNYNLLTSLNVSTLNDLEDFECGDNMLTSLQLGNLSHVYNLNCRHNQISSLDLTGMDSLENLECTGNDISSINASAITNLKYLQCGENQLTTLNIANLVDLQSLNAYSNQLTTLDFTTLTKLKYIDLWGNQFTSIDLSPLLLSYPANQWPPYQYNVGNNPNLTYLNIKNGIRLGMMCGGGHCWSSFNAGGSDNLAYICADEINFQYIDTAPNAQVNSYCSFVPGGSHNTITGTYTLDIDNNGCNENDPQVPNGRIQINDGLATGAAFTNSSGIYTLYTQTGDFLITPEFENPYYSISPSSATFTFTDSENHIQNQNFCITPNGVHNDVEISIIPIVFPRPGFDATYGLVYKNKGNQTLSGTVDFTFDDALADFITSTPALSNQAPNTLRWNYTDLIPFESRTIFVTLNVNSPQDVPPLNINDILNFTASIGPNDSDESIGDNTFALRQIVRGSFDPNDKTCLEGDVIPTEKVGDFLNYVIRFENSGTAAAENIVVKDVIDTEKYDISSLQLVASSHPHQTKITGDKVEFIFEGINLPAGANDEAESHGYVAFKIRTKNTLVSGDAVANTADIYFDYNFPTTTNTATTTVSSLTKLAFEDSNVSISPNPVKNNLNITAKQNITSIQLFDVQGRLIETSFANGTTAIFNMSQNASGIYFIKIYTEKGVKVEKIIKE